MLRQRFAVAAPITRAARRFLAVFSMLVCVLSASYARETQDPDALWVGREDFPNGMRALEIWAQRLETNSRDFESAWKLARACHWVPPHVSGVQADRERQRGIDAAKRAIKLKPDEPDGHFWLALNMGVLNERFDWMLVLKFEAHRAIDAVLKSDPGFARGTAEAARGRIYSKMRHARMGGSYEKAEESLRHALSHDPENPLSLVLLAEFLIERNRPIEARAPLEKVIGAPLDPERGPEHHRYKEWAVRLLASLK